MKGDKVNNNESGANNQRPNSSNKGSGNAAAGAPGIRSSPVIGAEAGSNLMQFLQTGGSSAPNSPSPVQFETAANTSSWLLDLKVKVVDILGKEWAGEVFTYDALTNCLILKSETSATQGTAPLPGATKRYTFHILKINTIQTIVPLQVEDIATNEAKIKVSPIDHVMLSANPAPRHINVDALAAREQKLLADARDKLRRLNPKAPGAGQQLFTALSKTLPCAWDQNDIIVLDEVRIKPLYKVETCEALTATSLQTLERVKKVLSSERKKLALDVSPTATPTKPDPRPGNSRKDAPPSSNKKLPPSSKKDTKPQDSLKK